MRTHGTYGGYQQHIQEEGTSACIACCAAKAAYMRKLRHRHRLAGMAVELEGMAAGRASSHRENLLGAAAAVGHAAALMRGGGTDG